MFGLKFNRFNTLYCYFIRRLIFVQSIFRKWNNFSFLLFYLIFFFVSLSYHYFNRSATGNNKLMFRINSSSLSLSLSASYSKRYIKLIYRLARSLNRNAGAKNELSKISRPVHLIGKFMMQSIEEREEERVSSWESYISPITSVGINPGQFILLNLFRLAQIVTVSRLQIKLPRKAVGQPSFQVRMCILCGGWREGEGREGSFRPPKIDDSRRGWRHREKFISSCRRCKCGGSLADKRKYGRENCRPTEGLYEFKREDEIILFIFILRFLLDSSFGRKPFGTGSDWTTIRSGFLSI